MGRRIVKVWYDPEGDFLEVLFEKKKKGISGKRVMTG